MAGNSLKPRDLLLKPIDIMRGIPGIFGLRLYQVNVVVRTWTGSRPGVDNSTSTDATNSVKIDVGTYNATVRQVTQREIFLSGGNYNDQDLKIGPITPPYTGSRLDNDQITIFDPLSTGATAEVFFNVQGPGYPALGSWFKKLSQNVTAPMRYTFVVRHTAETP